MTIEEMKRRKRELGYSNEELSELSGVPLGTIGKIFSGATKAPRSRTLRALEKVLFSQISRTQRESFPEGTAPGAAEADPLSFRYEFDSPVDCVRETAPAYGQKKRKYTIDDYYALPEERRVELIDGVFYDMAAPSFLHQGIIGELYMQLKECQRKHEGACTVWLSPVDVQLDRDRYTMLQPDLIVICDEEKLQLKKCYGAPELAIEVMSPSSRSRDSILKLNKYQKAGVQEFWLVDPENETVIVYRFEENPTFQIYSFDDVIPVGISGGTCSVDFSQIKAYLKSVLKDYGE